MRSIDLARSKKLHSENKKASKTFYVLDALYPSAINAYLSPKDNAYLARIDSHSSSAPKRIEVQP